MAMVQELRSSFSTFRTELRDIRALLESLVGKDSSSHEIVDESSRDQTGLKLASLDDEVVVLGQSSSSTGSLRLSPTDGVTFELAERVEEDSVAATSTQATAPELDLKMNDMCAAKMFDEMPTSADGVKVDKHIDVVCGGLKEVQNSITLSKFNNSVRELLMSYVVEILIAGDSDNPQAKIYKLLERYVIHVPKYPLINRGSYQELNYFIEEKYYILVHGNRFWKPFLEKHVDGDTSQGIFSVQFQAETMFKQGLSSEGFIEIHFPKLITSSNEVICVKMEIRKHYFEVKNNMDRLIFTIFDVLNERGQKELKVVGGQHFEPSNYKPKTMQLTFEEEVQMWKDAGMEVKTEATTLKISLEKEVMLAEKVFDEMLIRDEEVKVGKHMCGGLAEDYKLMEAAHGLNEIDGSIQVLPMSYVMETFVANDSDNPPPKAIALGLLTGDGKIEDLVVELSHFTFSTALHYNLEVVIALLSLVDMNHHVHSYLQLRHSYNLGVLNPDGIKLVSINIETALLVHLSFLTIVDTEELLLVHTSIRVKAKRACGHVWSNHKKKHMVDHSSKLESRVLVLILEDKDFLRRGDLMQAQLYVDKTSILVC